MSKKALVVSRADFTKFVGKAETAGPAFWNLDAKLMDRSECETDPTHLQLIPYITLVDFMTGEIFVYQRGKKGTETRQHGDFSVGLGGHVEELPSDTQSLLEVVSNAGIRELKEETGYDFDLESDFLYGAHILQSDNNDVSSVHLGVAVVVFVDKDEFTERANFEKQVITNGKWMKYRDIAATLTELEDGSNTTTKDGKLELWSIMVMDKYTEMAYNMLTMCAVLKAVKNTPKEETFKYAFPSYPGREDTVITIPPHKTFPAYPMEVMFNDDKDSIKTSVDSVLSINASLETRRREVVMYVYHKYDTKPKKSRVLVAEYDENNNLISLTRETGLQINTPQSGRGSFGGVLHIVEESIEQPQEPKFRYHHDLGTWARFPNIGDTGKIEAFLNECYDVLLYDVTNQEKRKAFHAKYGIREHTLCDITVNYFDMEANDFDPPEEDTRYPLHKFVLDNSKKIRLEMRPATVTEQHRLLIENLLSSELINLDAIMRPMHHSV